MNDAALWIFSTNNKKSDHQLRRLDKERVEA